MDLIAVSATLMGVSMTAERLAFLIGMEAWEAVS